MPACKHEKLSLEPSEHAAQAGYRRATPRQRLAAGSTTFGPSELGPKGTNGSKKALDHEPGTFPAPLVLPDDELSYDPTYAQQTFKYWHEEPARNEVTNARRTVYLAAPPLVDEQLKHAEEWSLPQVKTVARGQAARKRNASSPSGVPLPEPESVIDYFKAFYHPLPVKLLTPQLRLVPWDSQSESKSTKTTKATKATKTTKTTKTTYVALDIGTEAVRIRVRPSGDGIFSGQLNLLDLLDAAIAVLPEDAYALLFLVNQDTWESDDDFCCGRAYGGSRVAVVSTARYNPALDANAGVDRQHAWPASHCQSYAASLIDTRPTKKRKAPASKTAVEDTSLRAAVSASTYVTYPKSPEAMASLWLTRVCKTASHELGHCFGIDHCTQYACIMQGTSCLAEDARQPPYLCPIDLAKVLTATGCEPQKRYELLLDFCERSGADAMFVGFAAWLRCRLTDMSST